jgi:hypothetical protein
MGVKRFAVGLGLSLASLVVICCILEAVLRFLPVNEDLRTVAVNSESPVLRFAPNRDVLWSKFADFSMQNRAHVNNEGFVSDIDYDPKGKGPLLAVVGDSYVEALMVPWAKTLHGRLAGRMSGRLRVYSFGASGAALSQYLAYARHARDLHHPAKGLVVVIGNDFDESLPEYKFSPGLHFFDRSDARTPRLVLREYSPSLASRLVQRSQLFMYAVHNLQALGAVERLRRLAQGSQGSEGYVGQTGAEASPARLGDSRWAVDAFIALLPESFGLKPQDIMLVVDAPRPEIYGPATLEQARNSYFVLMRRYVIDKARQAGVQVVDLEPVMARDYAKRGERFEFPRDGHWNGHGHAVAAEAVLRSGFLGEAPGLER